MKLSDIEKSPRSSLDYMERLVNNGSKSGFSTIHNSSKQTNPLYSDGFILRSVKTGSESIRKFGNTSKYLTLCLDNSVFIHPDWLLPPNKDVLKGLEINEENYWVVPTSSSRTVRVKDQDWYIKLSYPGMIGRLDRILGYRQLVSAIEVNSIFENEKKIGIPLDYFEYMPEEFGELLSSNGAEIGYVVRKMPDSIKDLYIVPGFSLFSLDKESPQDSSILVQILERKTNPSDFLINELCKKLIDLFFWCSLNVGLIPEMHSQNVLFAFNKNWDLLKIVIRDFESIDKDISIRDSLNKDSHFDTFPYKCIKSNDRYYLLRHSFMYDHKLCEYLIEPMLEISAPYLERSVESIQKEIQSYVKDSYQEKTASFFPKDGNWYKYPNTEINRDTDIRPFIPMGNAIYR